MIANPQQKDTTIIKVVIGTAILIFILVFIAINAFLYQEKKLTNKIYPQVYVDNIPVGWKTKEEAKAYFHKKNTPLKNVTVSIVYKDQKVATLSAETLNLHSNSDEIIDRAYTIGRTPHTPSRIYQKIASLLNFTRFDFKTNVDYDKTIIQNFVTDLEDQYNKPAQNALFTFENGKVSTFRDDSSGLKLNTDKFYKDINKALNDENNQISNKSITYTDQTIKPEITLDKANEFGIEELIGEGKSNYTHSIPERVFNIKIAASKFQGVLIPQGKVISFNQIVGDISAQSGYKPAYVIKNGQTVLDDGGGVCQVSTTLFRAGMNTGLPILERTAHAYRVGYYENDSKPGLDATIFVPSVDLKIENDTPAAILIQTEIDENNNLLYIRFYGKKDGRRSEISEPVLSNQSDPLPAKYQDDPTLKKGVVKQVDFAASGAKSTFNYKVYMPNKEVRENTFVSVYRPWQAVYLVGTAD